MHNLEMLSLHVLLFMLCSIFPCLLMPHICPVVYVFISMNMPKWCSSFLLTSWCHVMSLILFNLCLFWSFSNYLIWSMLWVLCSHAMFVNFGYHMTFVPSLSICYHNVAVLHLLKLLQLLILPWCFEHVLGVYRDSSVFMFCNYSPVHHVHAFCFYVEVL